MSGAHVAGVALRDRREAADAAEAAQQRLAEPFLAPADRAIEDVPEGALVVKVSDMCLRVLRAERVERRQRPLFVARFMAPEAATRRIELLTNPRDVLPHLAFTDRTVADFLDRFPDRRRSQLRELLVDDLDGRRDVLAEDVVVNDQRRGARARRRGDEEGERPHPTIT